MLWTYFERDDILNYREQRLLTLHQLQPPAEIEHMYHVPYAHNHINLYGAVVALEKEFAEQEVRVDVYVETTKDSDPHPVRLRNRRALEMLAFYQANQQMYPNEPFLITVLGHVQTEQGCTRIIGDSVTFVLTPDVRTWGAQLVRTTVQHYEQLYGPKPWLQSRRSAMPSNISNSDAAPPADDAIRQSQEQRTNR